MDAIMPGGEVAGAGDGPLIQSIDVCICTFRRPSVRATLQSIAQQVTLPCQRIRAIVIDNDAVDSARELVERTGADMKLEVLYVHAPKANISIARNAGLAASRADWVAFIDDDEVAPDNWLDRLSRDCEDGDIVFGTSRALIDASDGPGWMLGGHFHSNRLEGNDATHNGYTCNVLMRRVFIEQHRLRFDLAAGVTGGEDSLFFESARQAGARFLYRPDAEVLEDIPSSRVNASWLLRRRFRAGQTHFLILARRGLPTWRIAPVALLKVAVFGLKAVLAASEEKRFSALWRAALHLGCLRSALGAATYEEYATR